MMILEVFSSPSSSMILTCCRAAPLALLAQAAQSRARLLGVRSAPGTAAQRCQPQPPSSSSPLGPFAKESRPWRGQPTAEMRDPLPPLPAPVPGRSAPPGAAAPLLGRAGCGQLCPSAARSGSALHTAACAVACPCGWWDAAAATSGAHDTQHSTAAFCRWPQQESSELLTDARLARSTLQPHLR